MSTRPGVVSNLFKKGRPVPIAQAISQTVQVLAALLAATVSPATVLAVVVFYLVFNALESYVIIPKVYGHELELSNVAVLIAVAVGGTLGGVMGALLALPIAAIYPTIERIWLRQRLSGDTVEVHQRLSA